MTLEVAKMQRVGDSVLTHIFAWIGRTSKAS